MNRVSWGMIGCGNVTESKSGPAFYKIENSSLHAVMCRNIDKAKDYARRHQVPLYYNNAEQLINNPSINAVYIATPVKFHAPYAIMAMQAGKAVYLEKPMALNYLQCLELKKVSEETGSKLFVAYYRRSLEYFIKIKELVKAKQIGELITVEISLLKPARAEDYNKNNLPWRVLPELSGAGYFYDLACHQLDILQFICGQITDANGKAYHITDMYPAEDAVDANWHFASGATGSGRWSFVCQENEKEDKIIITGTNGRIEFSTFDFTPIVFENETVKTNFEINPPVHIQMPFIRSVVNELTGRGASDADLNSAIATSKIMEDIVYNN